MSKTVLTNYYLTPLAAAVLGAMGVDYSAPEEGVMVLSDDKQVDAIRKTADIGAWEAKTHGFDDNTSCEKFIRESKPSVLSALKDYVEETGVAANVYEWIAAIYNEHEDTDEMTEQKARTLFEGDSRDLPTDIDIHAEDSDSVADALFDLYGTYPEGWERDFPVRDGLYRVSGIVWPDVAPNDEESEIIFCIVARTAAELVCDGIVNALDEEQDETTDAIYGEEDYEVFVGDDEALVDSIIENL